MRSPFGVIPRFLCLKGPGAKRGLPKSALMDNNEHAQSYEDSTGANRPDSIRANCCCARIMFESA
jgi:hypothetical protein